MAKKKVTSSDVAKRAGVSQATVSMVLNKKYNVSFSKEVIQKVEAAAGELGYELPKRRTQRGERREKLLVVISPNLMCDAKVFEVLPVKKEAKVVVSGIYITGIKSVRGGLDIPEKKKKKRFFSKKEK